MIREDGTRTMPAAAIPQYAVVRTAMDDDDAHNFDICTIINSCPEPGFITWLGAVGQSMIVGGAKVFEIVSLP